MRAAIRPVFIRLSLLTLLFGGAGFYILHSRFAAWYLPAFPFLLLFFAVIFFTFSALLILAKQRPPREFINRFMLFTGIKFLTLLFAIVLWLFLGRDDPVIFLIYVLVLYLGFSIVSHLTILSGKD